jgi:hypothetical protein
VFWLARIMSSKLAKQIATVVLVEIAGALAKKKRKR